MGTGQVVQSLHLASPLLPNMADAATLYSFLLSTMLYTVRLQYGFNVDATNKTTAFRIASRMLQEKPQAFISRIEQADKPRGNPSLIKRIITGK